MGLTDSVRLLRFGKLTIVYVLIVPLIDHRLFVHVLNVYRTILKEVRGREIINFPG